MTRIKAVIFDLDGVLIDAKEWHFRALNKALGLFGFMISRDEHLVQYDGLPTRQKLELLTREKGLPRSLHAFINKVKQKYTHEIAFNKCRPVFSHEYALSRLKAKGYRIAVASNSMRESVALMLTRANLLKYVEFFLSNEDVEKSKPDPEIYLKAFQNLHLQPSECLALEDNEHGIKAALASGAHLMRIGSVDEVTLENIQAFLTKCDGAGDD